MSLKSVVNRGARRAVYDVLCGREPMDFWEYTANIGTTKPSSYGRTQAERSKVYEDGEGMRYFNQPYCLFGKNNKKLKIKYAEGGYVYTDDDKRHRVSSVKFCY